MTPAEIDAVFDRAVDLAGSPENPVFVAEPPAPADYLPVKALVPGETKEENLSEVSFDLVAALAAKNLGPIYVCDLGAKRVPLTAGVVMCRARSRQRPLKLQGSHQLGERILALPVFDLLHYR